MIVWLKLKLFIVCTIFLSAKGKLPWNELPIPEDAQDKLKSNWYDYFNSIRSTDEVTGQNLAPIPKEIEDLRDSNTDG